MPERSAKMKRRIFGFHRRVWWPKWTPASSRSCSWGCAMRVFVSCPYLGLCVHRVHLRPLPPKGHPRPDPAMCEMILCCKPSLGIILSEAKDRVGGTREAPASLAGPSRSFASLRMTRYRLPLAELEPLPRARTARLLALDGARIAGHETGRAQLGPVLPVGLHQGPRNRVPERARLSRLAAAVHVRPHVERAQRVRGGEALLDVVHER